MKNTMYSLLNLLSKLQSEYALQVSFYILNISKYGDFSSTTSGTQRIEEDENEQRDQQRW